VADGLWAPSNLAWCGSAGMLVWGSLEPLTPFHTFTLHIYSHPQPVGALNMAMHVLYRFSRALMASFMAVSQSTDAGKDAWRASVG
jgi:hypothetical protein